MTTFIAIYRGDSVADAKLIAVSADPELVSRIASSLLKQENNLSDDNVLDALFSAKRKALEFIEEELNNERK